MNPPPHLPPPGDPSLRGAMNTFASNPARVRVNWLKFLVVRPGITALLLSTLLLAGFLAITGKPIPALVIAFATIISAFKMVAQVNGKFRGGDVCPAMVISASPAMIAVSTNMMAGIPSPRPAIKILRQPLSLLPGGTPPVGTRLATVAQYRSPVREGAWQDFFPDVIALFVSDPAEVQRVTDSITELEWQTLDNGIALLTQPTEGLHRLWGTHLNRPATKSIRDKLAVAVFAFIALMIVLRVGIGLMTASSRHLASSASVSKAIRPMGMEPAIPETDPTPPIASQPQSNPHAQSNSAPLSIPTSVEFTDRVATFTNLSGKVYRDAKLIRADGRMLIYMNDGGGGSVPLRELPLDFLESIGVPTNWPGVMAGSMTVGGTTTPTVASKGNFVIGDRVEANWGGKWQPGVIVAKNPNMVQVRLADPQMRVPVWRGVAEVRYP